MRQGRQRAPFSRTKSTLVVPIVFYLLKRTHITNTKKNSTGNQIDERNKEKKVTSEM